MPYSRTGLHGPGCAYHTWHSSPQVKVCRVCSFSCRSLLSKTSKVGFCASSKSCTSALRTYCRVCLRHWPGMPSQMCAASQLYLRTTLRTNMHACVVHCDAAAPMGANAGRFGTPVRAKAARSSRLTRPTAKSTSRHSSRCKSSKWSVRCSSCNASSPVAVQLQHTTQVAQLMHRLGLHSWHAAAVCCLLAAADAWGLCTHVCCLDGRHEAEQRSSNSLPIWSSVSPEFSTSSLTAAAAWRCLMSLAIGANMTRAAADQSDQTALDL